MEDEDDDEEEAHLDSQANGTNTTTTSSQNALVEAAKQRVQDKIALQLKQEKDLIEETKRDLEFSQQLQKLKDEEEKQQKEAHKRKQEAAAADEDEEDPLDAYMKEISKKSSKHAPKTVKKEVVVVTNATIIKAVKVAATVDSEMKAADENGAKKMVNVVMGVAKTANVASKNKGAIMEQDIDGLEYGSDEENQEAAAAALNDDFMSNIDSATGQPKVKTKSEMVITDHEKVYYRPFRKDFYVEVPEIGKMSAEDTELFRLELEGIKVKGKNCPKPIKTWAQCGVSFKVMECLKR